MLRVHFNRNQFPIFNWTFSLELPFPSLPPPPLLSSLSRSSNVSLGIPFHWWILWVLLQVRFKFCTPLKPLLRTMGLSICHTEEGGRVMCWWCWWWGWQAKRPLRTLIRCWAEVHFTYCSIQSPLYLGYRISLPFRTAYYVVRLITLGIRIVQLLDSVLKSF